MLGERQWQWLERQLEVPAELRLFGSSVQVLADFTGWEAWANFARDQDRLFDVIRRKRANGVLFLSGDIHYAELSKREVNVPYPMWDLTSSGLTEEWRVPTPNANRASEVVADANFGYVDIDWRGAPTRLALGIVDAAGRDADVLELAARGSRRARMTMTAVRGALFDLDGTLVDSEVHTDTAIRVIAGRHGVPGFALPHTETRGRTWAHIADVMRTRTGITCRPRGPRGRAAACWSDIAADVTPIPGAPEAIREAATRLPLGVVSSSPRAVIDAFLGKLGIADCVDAARAHRRRRRCGPPSPTRTASCRAPGRSASRPRTASSFEDSRAGLEAARAAGMRSMFIMCCAADIPGNTALATAACTDYRHLPPRFWQDIADGGLDIAGRVYA